MVPCCWYPAAHGEGRAEFDADVGFDDLERTGPSDNPVFRKARVALA